jgi:hypothetical protein
MNPPSAIYVSTWVHLNNREDDPMPVKMVQGGLSEIFVGVAGQFRDRPDLAVGEPFGGACSLQVDVPGTDALGNATVETVAQTIPATPAYLAFTTFTGAGTTFRDQFMKSLDCGKPGRRHEAERGTSSARRRKSSRSRSRRILVFWRQERTATVGRHHGREVGRRGGRSQASRLRPALSLRPARRRPRSLEAVPPWRGRNRAYVVWADRRDASGVRTSTVGGVEAEPAPGGDRDD